ncbi:aldehyde dehydrogenase family protein [Acrocarpospora macrocephala]|uniref:Aldehyde dehydrogenase n=1 Tax=Acrocarpospora macrocephala TaxID=150177 RepID=A0A5M3WK85_9ACTN|nr:aldehyde dehydrogenase family protein [Acrocarpospora macrocephala]GES09597.1 aldehyde dehydrogenase [Acrocarpospora macrocephala]
MFDHPMTVDGADVRTDRRDPVLDPATEQVIGHAPIADAEHLDQAVEAAARAFPAWAAAPPARREALTKAASAVESAADTIARVVAVETGKPQAESLWEVRSMAAFLRYNAALEAPRTVLKDDAEASVEVVHRPIGPIGAIIPWNAPVYVLGLKLGPALAAGCTVVVKPSPFTPLSALLVGVLLREALPPGVVNVINGGNDLGAAMTAHPGLRKITLTGSTATGKRVLAGAADQLKRITLELGGNDPAILLDDVDLDAQIEKIFWAAFRGTGQACVAIKRLYAPEALYDEVVARLAELADTVVVGPGTDPASRLGPLTTPAQLDLVARLVEDAVSSGARVVSGGARLDRPGYFYAPTILADARDGMRVVDEEQFGPVLPVVPYTSLEEVMRHVNVGDYGLGASVWTGDLATGAEVAARFESGLSWVNTHRATLGPQQPTHGWKHSGLGVEKGMWGYLSFTEIQVRYVARN